MLRENDFAASDDARLDHGHDIGSVPDDVKLGADLVDLSPQARAAAITRSRRLPDPSLMPSAWHSLPVTLQTQIGTAALTHSFYSLAPEVPGRELVLSVAQRCEAVASEALTAVDGIAKAALPGLYGTDEAEPEWALSDTPMVLAAPPAHGHQGAASQPSEVAAAAVARSKRIPGLDDFARTWARLPPDAQDQIGTQALAVAFYGWLTGDAQQEPAERWLTDDAVGMCNIESDHALNLMCNIAEGAMPELYGTKDLEPEWARATEESYATAITPTPISLAITLHRRAWQTLQAGNAFLTATGKADRKRLVWPALDAEDEALTDLLTVSVRSRQDAAEMVAHLHWYLAVSSQHPNRPAPVEADRGLIAARLTDLGMVLGEVVPGAAPCLAPGALVGLIARHRAAWCAYRDAAVVVMAEGWDAVGPLSSAVHEAAEGVLRAPCGSDRAEAEALVAHAGWYAEELAAAGDDVADGLDYVARQLTARAGDLALFVSLGDDAMRADCGALEEA